MKLTLPLVSMLPEPVLGQLHLQFGHRFEALKGDALQAAAIAATEGAVSNQRLQEVLSLHRVDITRLLQGMVRDGFLIPDGIGRGTRYRLGGPDATSILVAGIPAHVDGAEYSGFAHELRSESVASSETTDRSPLAKEPSPLAKGPNPLVKGPSPLVKDPNPRAEGVQPGISAEQDERLLQIASSVRKSGRVTPAKMTQTILALCQDRFITLRELSILLKREPENLRHKYLTPLGRSGKLELLHPNSASHPAQAYRTRKTQ